MQRFDWPGKYRFYQFLCKTFGHYVIQHKIAAKPFVVPVDEWCFWLECGPQNYYLNEFVPFFEMINQNDQAFTFIDLGADIGTVSVLANFYCSQLSNIFAFEPNPQSFRLLQTNLHNIDKPSFEINAAVSDFDGQVCFSRSSTSTIDHEGHIDVSRTGDTAVFSLDTWFKLNPNELAPLLVIKIDVEGQEAAVFKGASQLIKNAKKIIVLLEIHPDVLNASNMSAEDLFEQAEVLRDFNWSIPLLKNQIVDRTIPLFTQVPCAQYDIIGVSTAN
jgi:FkbM family methyltransferase